MIIPGCYVDCEVANREIGEWGIRALIPLPLLPQQAKGEQ